MIVNIIRISSLSIALLAAMFLNMAHASETGSRLQSVEKLLETSSAAQQIKSSDNQVAKDKHQQAIELFDKAKLADGKGDEQKAADLLKQATKAMFEATRMIKKDDSFMAKDIRDFDVR